MATAKQNVLNNIHDQKAIVDQIAGLLPNSKHAQKAKKTFGLIFQLCEAFVKFLPEDHPILANAEAATSASLAETRTAKAAADVAVTAGTAQNVDAAQTELEAVNTGLSGVFGLLHGFFGNKAASQKMNEQDAAASNKREGSLNKLRAELMKPQTMLGQSINPHFIQIANQRSQGMGNKMLHVMDGLDELQRELRKPTFAQDGGDLRVASIAVTANNYGGLADDAAETLKNISHHYQANILSESQGVTELTVLMLRDKVSEASSIRGQDAKKEFYQSHFGTTDIQAVNDALAALDRIMPTLVQSPTTMMHYRESLREQYHEKLWLDISDIHAYVAAKGSKGKYLKQHMQSIEDQFNELTAGQIDKIRERMFSDKTLAPQMQWMGQAEMLFGGNNAAVAGALNVLDTEIGQAIDRLQGRVATITNTITDNRVAQFIGGNAHVQNVGNFLNCAWDQVELRLGTHKKHVEAVGAIRQEVLKELGAILENDTTVPQIQARSARVNQLYDAINTDARYQQARSECLRPILDLLQDDKLNALSTTDRGTRDDLVKIVERAMAGNGALESVEIRAIDTFVAGP